MTYLLFILKWFMINLFLIQLRRIIFVLINFEIDLMKHALLILISSYGIVRQLPEVLSKKSCS